MGKISVPALGGPAWTKLGRIFVPRGGPPWRRTHAAVPFAEPLGGGRFRVYFSSRDSRKRSHTGRLDLDLQSRRILSVSARPVLAPGPLGGFDDSGTMGSWLVHHRGIRYLYYIGWNLGVTVPFRNAIGLAVSRDGGNTFERASEGPVLDRDPVDPYFVASSCVRVEGGTFRMWYLSCTGWKRVAGRPRHDYLIKYAESRDGILWTKKGIVCIGFARRGEYAISRPSVVRDGDLWRMWYSFRGKAYGIGYAESSDGIGWKRRDAEAGIDVSASGWDSEMIEYPFVFDHGGRRYMLYNGNGYGRTGFGLAVRPDHA